MKVENIQRATEVEKELETLNKNIRDAKDMVKKAEKGKLTLIIGEYTDQSGLNLDYMYKSGNASPVYAKIAPMILQVLEEEKEALLKEIESL